MDDKILTEINEMLKADGKRKLSPDELKDAVGGGSIEEWKEKMAKLIDERNAFKAEICKRTGMRTVEKAILTNQLSPAEQKKWVEINDAYHKNWDRLIVTWLFPSHARTATTARASFSLLTRMSSTISSRSSRV